jgi:hypothetical protein
MLQTMFLAFSFDLIWLAGVFVAFFSALRWRACLDLAPCELSAQGDV